MKIIQELLHKVSFGLLPPSPPKLTTSEQWRTYWESEGQPWRREPEIDRQRQVELAQKRTIVPNIKQGIYPFQGTKLSRADVEWLLATHDNGRGPVDWHANSQRERRGLDLRGADLRQVDLSRLPLACLLGGLIPKGQEDMQKQREMAAILLEDANLRQTHLEGAILRAAHLERAILHEASLQGANLRAAHLEKANLYRAQLQESYLRDAHLQGADLRGAFLDTASNLTNATLSDRQFGSLFLTDIHWGDVNLAPMTWSQLKMLGEEHVARQKKRNDGEKKDKATQLEEYQGAVRGNRQLSVALQNQGLNEDAAYFAYRAQALQKTVFRLQMLQSHASLRQRLQSSGYWLFSWFLFLLAGYGYKLWRSFLAYLLVIGIFTSLYLLLTPHLVWYEAIIVSMTAFHGRGFSPSTFSPGDPLSIASAFEAFVGLIIEVTFIATLTQRFFNK